MSGVARRLAGVPDHSAATLTLDDARAEAETLTTRILDARDAYYGRDASLVDDATYDRWMQRLEELERLFPELRGQDSPTQTVGAAGETGAATIQHAERMLSLDNVFSPDELREWMVKTQTSAGRPVAWLTELKIDGLALDLVYRDGRQTYSLLVRNNLRRENNRGAFELSWHFPLHGRLNGYVQFFSGYGESLIDYDHIQQTLGFGISLTEGI